MWYALILIIGLLVIGNTAFGIVHLSNLNRNTTLTSKNVIHDPDSTHVTERRFISVMTDRTHYVVGDSIQIFGRVYDQNGNPVSQPILIHVNNFTSKPHSAAIYGFSIFANGSFSLPEVVIQNPGTYVVNASLPEPWNNSSIYTFVIESPFYSLADIMLYIAAANVGALLLSLFVKKLSISAREIVMFIFISGFVVSTLIGLLFSDTQLGTESPVGVILKHPRDENGQIKLNNFGQPAASEWMINVGGHSTDNYAEGIQIPIYVFAFGLIGGYLRYLHDTATTTYRDRLREFNQYLEDEVKKEQVESKQENMRKRLMRRHYVFITLGRLALIFLSPILAIAVWLVLSQLGLQGQQTTQGSIFLMAAISFTIGLVTNEAVNNLIGFAKRTLPSSPDKQNEKQKNPGLP